jgi:hypothetical protein
MRSIIFKVTVFFFVLLNLLNTNLFSQQDSIVNKLNSEIRKERRWALNYIEDNNLTQYVDEIENRIFSNEDDFEVYNFLRVLDQLNSPNLLDITLHSIDTIDYYPSSAFMDKLELKVAATEILIKLQNYTTINYLWQILERDKPGGKIEPSVIKILSELLYVPQYEARAKQELLDIYNNSYYKNMEDGLFNFRPPILGILVKKYGMEIKDILLESFLNDPSVSIRVSSIDYLREIKYPGLDTLLLYKLYSQTPDTVVNPIIGLNITQMLNTPQGWYTLITYKPTIVNQNVEDAIRRYVESRRYSEAKRIYLESLTQYIDTVKTFINDLQTYQWLGDLTFSNELKSILTTAKSNLQNGDSLTCRIQVKAFQDLVDDVYKDSLNSDPRFVTIEGWKFLYWNAQYILDRLPSPPVIVNADIEVINPAMSLVNPGSFTMEVKGTGFSANSTVYFNGSARATTFISDSVLNVQIISTDVSAAGSYPVWVSDGATNSDTLIYKVVSTLPQPVRPVLECVRNNGDGTYTAFFGYKNDNNVSVYIPVGNKNKFTPTPQDRGQTRVFEPGRHYKVFTVNFNGSNLVWTLNGRTSTASSNSTPCN